MAKGIPIERWDSISKYKYSINKYKDLDVYDANISRNNVCHSEL